MTRAGVSVYTWGPKNEEPDSTRGLKDFARSYLFGGNIGHASILLTLPDNEQNRKMVNEILGRTNIPVVHKRYQTKKIEFFEDEKPPVVKDEDAYVENVIEIYFSWWPDYSNNTFRLSTFEKDTVTERLGVDFEYAPDWKKFFNPEQRRITGLLSRIVPERTITLGPRSIIHERGFSSVELDVLKSAQQVTIILDEYESVSILLNSLTKKILSHHGRIFLDTTEKLIIARLFPEASFDKLDAKTALKRIEEKCASLFSAYFNAKYNYILSLDKLNGAENRMQILVELSATLKTHKERLKNLRSLNDCLQRFDIQLSSESAIAEINAYIKNEKTFAEIYPHGIAKDNVDEIKKDVEYQLDPKKVGSLAAFYNRAFTKYKYKKTYLKKIYHCLDTIELYNQLVEKIKQYQKASSPSQKKVLKDELLEWLESKSLFLNDYRVFLIETFNPGNVVQESDNLARIIEHIELSAEQESKSFCELITDTKKAELLDELQKGKAEKLFEMTRVEGNLPSQTVHIPLKDEQKNGLDAQKMLLQMEKFVVQKSRFNLVNNNCSVTTNEVLAAGTKEHHRIFERRALGMTSTPQMVYNNSIQYLQQIEKENASSKKENRSKPLEFSKPIEEKATSDLKGKPHEKGSPPYKQKI